MGPDETTGFDCMLLHQIFVKASSHEAIYTVKVNSWHDAHLSLMANLHHLCSKILLRQQIPSL